MKQYSTILRATIGGIMLLCFLQTQALAGGFIIVPPDGQRPGVQAFPLELRKQSVQAEIHDRHARTETRQTFYNPGMQRLEGWFLFPIPPGASIQNFSMEINGVEQAAEFLDADKARSIYEEIVRKQRDPALLEFGEQGLFKVRIFPIMPQSEQKIRISYEQALAGDDGMFAYNYALRAKDFNAGNTAGLNFLVELHSTGSLKNIFSPTHCVDIVRKSDTHARISFESTHREESRDFALFFNKNNGRFGASLLSYKAAEGEDGYFFLSLSPGMETEGELVEKDISFVLDASGSMAGEKLQQAKNALQYCIANLNKGDRFNVIRFSTEAEALFSGLEAAESAAIERAGRFITDIRPAGGTNIHEALQTALNTATRAGRPHMIIFLTDGKPTIGLTDETALLQLVQPEQSKLTRIFTFGIGYDVNTHLLDKISEATRGFRSYVEPGEDIELKVSSFYRKVAAPVLTDVRLQFEGVQVRQVYPNKIPDIFRATEVLVFGRYSGSGDAGLKVSGTVNGKQQSFTYKLRFGGDDKKHEFIAPLWATRAVGYLLDQIRLHGESKEVLEELLAIARKHAIITPYTSYLIIEDEAQQVSRRQLQPRDQLLRGNVMQDEGFRLRNQVAPQSLAAPDGARGVANSKRLNTMVESNSTGSLRMADEDLSYRDAQGAVRNLALQNRHVQGRAVYRNGNEWLDSEVQRNAQAPTLRIRFASPEYFALVRNLPAAGDFLALGRNVRFHLNNTNYEIHD